MSVFRVTRRIEFYETDMAGIVHFANFFRFMESAEVEFLRSLGLGVQMDWESQMIGFPRVSATCDYFKPARFEDLLTVHVHVERLGDKSVTYGFEFKLDGARIAYGKVTSVCCRKNPDGTLVSVAIPASYRQKLEAYLDK